MERPFLTARWEHLVIINYECPRELLDPLVPAGTALDLWEQTALVSLVGFVFRDTRVRGLSVPCHRTFEEINLRFYVRRTVDGAVRRGVVFIREIAPRRAIVAIARRVYNEPYVHGRSMTHEIDVDPASGGAVAYGWRYAGEAYALTAAVEGPPARIEAGSEGQFVGEHFWGYTPQRDGRTLEYRVKHPRWSAWAPRTRDVSARGAFESLYGAELGSVLRREPRSSLLALGGPVSVYRGVRLTET